MNEAEAKEEVPLLKSEDPLAEERRRSKTMSRKEMARETCGPSSDAGRACCPFRHERV